VLLNCFLSKLNCTETVSSVWGVHIRPHWGFLSLPARPRPSCGLSSIRTRLRRRRIFRALQGSPVSCRSTSHSSHAFPPQNPKAIWFAGLVKQADFLSGLRCISFPPLTFPQFSSLTGCRSIKLLLPHFIFLGRSKMPIWTTIFKAILSPTSLVPLGCGEFFPHHISYDTHCMVILYLCIVCF